MKDQAELKKLKGENANAKSVSPYFANYVSIKKYLLKIQSMNSIADANFDLFQLRKCYVETSEL